MKAYVYSNFVLEDSINSYQRLECSAIFRDHGKLYLIQDNLMNKDDLKPGNVIDVDGISYMIDDYFSYISLAKELKFEVWATALSGLLERRVLFTKYKATNEPVEIQIRRLIQQNFISPTDPNRAVPELMLGPLKGFTETMNPEEFDKKSVGQVVRDMCKVTGLGFRIDMDLDNKKYVFHMIRGADVSDRVIFSPELGNLNNQELKWETSNHKNVVYMNNNGTIDSRGSVTGLERREMIFDGLESGKMIEELNKNAIKMALNGDIITTEQFQYKADWNLGDYVMVDFSMFAVKQKSQITEVKNIYSDRHDVEVVFGERR